MWERERKIKKVFLCFRGARFKSKGQYNGFWLFGVIFFPNLFPWHLALSQPDCPIGWCMHFFDFFSILNVCSGLDAISQLSAPVTYVRPRLCNNLIYLLWIFMNCKAIKAQFSSMLSNCNSHRLQWERQRVLSTSEMWSLLQSCVLVIMLMLYH